MLICVKCFADLRCEKNGVMVARDPFCVQHADVYKCHNCGYEILTSAGNPLDYVQAQRIYDREISKYRRLYKVDKKVIIAAEAVNVG